MPLLVCTSGLNRVQGITISSRQNDAHDLQLSILAFDAPNQALRKAPRLTVSPTSGRRVQNVSDDRRVSAPSVRKAWCNAALTAI